MKRNHLRDSRHRRGRTGFTLIELLVVLVIIGILAAILLPVIGGAMRRGRITEVQSEIRMIETAMTEFKTRHGTFPPSRIHLHEDPVNGLAYGAHNNVTLDAIDLRTIQFLKRMFPNFNPQNPASAGLNVYDYNGNGQTEQFLDINGSECLVLFLGGMPMPFMTDPGGGGENLVGLLGGNLSQVTTRGVEGFSRVPQLPFGRSAVDPGGGNLALAVGATQRFEPHFQFQVGRLSDVDLDGFWEYYDPSTEPAGSTGTFDPTTMPHPYAYFSAYDGKGYSWYDAGGAVGIIPTYDNTWGVAQAGLRWPLSINSVDPATTPLSQIRWWNDKSYQIHSPGIVDGLLGNGLAVDGAAPFNPDNPAYEMQFLSPEMHDNLTNFSGGQLEDME